MHGSPAPVFDPVPGQGPGVILSDPTIRPMQSNGPASFFAMRPIDLQGNGRPDLFTCYGIVPPATAQKMPVRVFRPQSDGSITDITRQLFGNGALPGAVGPRVIVPGDFNEDGRIDIFIACQGWDAPPFPGEVNVLLLSQPEGTYTDASANLPQLLGFTHDACTGDINGDGHLDLYVGNIGGQQGSTPYLLMGQGDGTFNKVTTGLPATITNMQESFTTCLFADIDGDGSLDLALGDNNSGSFVLFNNGSGDFTTRARLALPAGPMGAGVQLVQSMGALDINRDGRMDLILQAAKNSNNTGNAVQILINQGNGVMADESTERLGSAALRLTGGPLQAMRFADLNADGLIDFYFSNGPQQDGPRYFLANADGTFSAVAQNALPIGLGVGVTAVNFDNDSRVDLLQIIHQYPDGDVMYQSFLNHTPVPPVLANTSDFNADGKSDILWRNRSTGEVGVWLMNGTSVASYLPIGGVELEYLLSGTGDFNGDGKTDILWRHQTTGEVGAWLMNGTSVLSYATLGAVGLEMAIGATGDLNADGKTDILWRHQTTGEVGVWLMNDTTVGAYVSLGSAARQLRLVGTGDFNTDGQTDLLWRNRSTGEVSTWLLNGTNVVTATNLGSAGLELTIAGTGEYNGDGKTDILWRNTNTGEVGAWLMNGVTVSSYVKLGTVGLELEIPTSGEPEGAPDRSIVDFNQDGKTDILWRNQVTGEVGAWLMNGTTVVSYVKLGEVGPTWSITGTGDVSGDQQADILWRNPAHEVGAWIMNGSAVTAYALLGSVGPGWAIMGTGDFNSDGETDILWRNTNNGDVGAWLFSNGAVGGYSPIGSVGLGWQIAGLGDFNVDGKVDILWRDLGTGGVGVWLMNGTTVSGYAPIGSVGLSWSVAGTGDFNGDGKPDILWRDTGTGGVGVWLMNGTTVSSYTSIGSVGQDWQIRN